MATYTANYQLTLPGYADVADVADLNHNATIIDEIMHSSQISLADAYDSTQTYNAGDVVMYQYKMYKCTADGVTGTWDPTKWERTTAAETGGGAGNLYGEASGNPATFPDGTAGALVECGCDVNPIQNLHGYGKPWPGGAGKNKCSIAVIDQQYLNNYDFDTPIPAGTYYVSWKRDGSTEGIGIRFYYVMGDSSQSVVKGAADHVMTFTAPVVGANFAIASYNSGDKVYDLMIEAGSTGTTFEPYTNICPITAHTSADITHTGFNIWDEQWESGTYNGTTGAKQNSSTALRNKKPIPVLNAVYYAKFSGVITSSNNVLVFAYDADMTYLGNIQITSSNPDRELTTLPANTAYINFRWIGSTYGNNICINVSGVYNGRYEAYNGDVETVTFGTSVYGGRLNVKTGELVVDRNIIDLGDLSWEINNHQTLGTYFYANISSYDFKYEGNFSTAEYDSISSQYVCAKRSATYFIDGTFCFDGQTATEKVTQLQIKDSRYDNASDFETAMAGVELCYKIANPTTLTLTPAEVESLLGHNNIWSDTGAVDVVYIRNLNSCINDILRRLAALEA